MYSTYLRERIIKLSQSLSGKYLICALREEGFTVSKSGVYYLLKKYRPHHIIHDCPRSGRPLIFDDQTHDIRVAYNEQ